MHMRQAAFFVITIATMALCSQTWATTFYVTNNADAGVGSLRTILFAAQDGDTIKFQPNVTTVNLTSGELVIDKSVTIIGKVFYRTTIQRDAAAVTPGRVLHMGPGSSNSNRVSIVLQNLRITGGDATNAGGGIYIDEHTDLTMTDSVLNANRTSTVGGAIDITGTATLALRDCTLSNNTADDWGGAIAIPYGGAADISGSTFVGNTALQQGGAILVQSWPDNNDSAPGAVNLNILNSTFTGNSESTNASTILLVRQGSRADHLPVNVTAAFKNLTISGNTGPNAVYTYDYPSDGSISVTLNNSIVADAMKSLKGPNISGSNNIFSDAPTLTAGSNNHINTDPMLTILGNFAGPTQTMEPQPGSPAIDAMACATAPLIDQRGVIRPDPTSMSATPCDIGAVELNAPFDEIFKDGFE